MAQSRLRPMARTGPSTDGRAGGTTQTAPGHTRSAAGLPLGHIELPSRWEHTCPHPAAWDPAQRPHKDVCPPSIGPEHGLTSRRHDPHNSVDRRTRVHSHRTTEPAPRASSCASAEMARRLGGPYTRTPWAGPGPDTSDRQHATCRKHCPSNHQPGVKSNDTDEQRLHTPAGPSSLTRTTQQKPGTTSHGPNQVMFWNTARDSSHSSAILRLGADLDSAACRSCPSLFAQIFF